MSLHKITAGSGYDYLTRQVARQDSTEGGRPSLASYYTEKGEVPGRWVGSGLAGLAAHDCGVQALEAGDRVTAAHMQALYGAGFHPQAAERQQRLLAAREDDPLVWAAASRLGSPFRVFNDDVTEFRAEVARRFAEFNRQHGRPDDAPIPLDDRARMRSDVAREMFVQENGRDLLDERERAGNLARLSRQRTTAVAGFDLTFSPVKSVSTLWALAPSNVAATIERAHDQAVADALDFIEREALYTRLGDGGVRQVDTRGLIAAAFTHRDSRAGDPDLHTHVAVANKVQDARDGRWLAIDGRVLYKAIVAASETYNTALEKHLATMLGVQFTERPNADPRKRPVREIVGVDPRMNERWSTRRQAIEARRAVLATEFQAAHGRPPTPTESIALAQQANLETRDAKHAPRSLAEQRATWHHEALGTLGGQRAIKRMINAALHPSGNAADATITDDWLDDTAHRVVATVEANRSTWQYWHLHAEATRRVRAANIHPTRISQAVARIVDRARDEHSIALTRTDRISEPDALRRRDGISVYEVAGSTLYTSLRILDAEARILAHAGRTDGHTIDPEHITVALLETAANGVELNTGQAQLVTQMATSGRRVQVAIAPAGSGKTTAMDALTRAWTTAGGSVVGLAPSAAAAAQLRDQTGATTDTLAKLTDALMRGQLPKWARSVDRTTLVLIDEAGMADTLTLDRAITYLLGKGASVRLIGDDQQLAAIGAGGVLRDIDASHGALRLHELVRFADPAEGAASLAIRDGRPEGLGFYLDHQRVHVGDLATLTENVFTAWTTDRSDGLDSIMVAPTRDLVTALNQRARTHRLNGKHPKKEVVLADGSRACAGDTIITRANDRRLRLSASDWVKNGDRWIVTRVNPAAGTIRARHARSGLRVTLPAKYVAASVDLGYACTIHTAQGVSVDTTHGLATAGESRQQLYTMLTRGRHANHVYLEVVTDGNEHSLLRPETLNPDTPTDLLEAVLARDASPVSASTQLRNAGNLAPRLGDAAAAYYDAIGVAAESLRSELELYTLERRTNQMIPGITLADAWPALRAQLLYIAATDHDPYQALERALGEGPLGDAHDAAAVLSWRLDTTTAGRRGPLPWLPSIPDALRDHPTWGSYLDQRHDLVRDLAGELRRQTLDDPQPPAWLVAGIGNPTPDTLADIAVWRAATRTEPGDIRPLGAAQPGRTMSRHQRHLQQLLAIDVNPAVAEWQPLVTELDPMTARDDFLPVLAQRLAQLSAAGLDAATLVRDAAREGVLPDDHAAAALWWRIDCHLTPDAGEALTALHRLPETWLDTLRTAVGDVEADRLQSSTWWPTLVTAIERGYQRGWPLERLLGEHRTAEAGHNDPCQAMAWRIATITEPLAPGDDFEPDENPAPEDLHVGYLLPDTPVSASDVASPVEPPLDEIDEFYDPQLDLGYLALVREAILATPPEYTDADIERMMRYADAWRDCPHTRERLVQINEMAATYYQNRYTDSWARAYLHERFGDVDEQLAAFRPGYAPDGWTSLTTHLRRHGVTDDELLAAGLATTARTGRLIDRFRDRVVFPIAHENELLGFVGRRNPADDGDKEIPKYLNTPETPLFHKGEQLYMSGDGLAEGVTPVIVEGPMDAIAINLCGGTQFVGVAPLGTALTDQQVRQLGAHGVDPILATDDDQAGREAAERAYWLLARCGLGSRSARLPAGADPADLVSTHAQRLAGSLRNAPELATILISRRLARSSTSEAVTDALRVLAARRAEHWGPDLRKLRHALGMPDDLLRPMLARLAADWNHDPRAATSAGLHASGTVRDVENAAPRRTTSLEAPGFPAAALTRSRPLAPPL